METTGGMIAADKSHFYHIDWEFKNGIPIPKEPHPDDAIKLQQIDGFDREFKKMQNTDEHKTLGCWVNPLGNNKKAFQQMESFMRNWVNRMKHSQLPAKLIRKSYDSELKSQLKYRLPIYMFTKQQCDELMKIVNPTLLHANYMNKNYPRSLLQAGDQYGGINLTHIYDLMGMEKSKFLLMHLRRKDTTAKLLEIEFQNIQLECGSETLFFNLEYDKFSHLVTESWSKHLWKYYDDRAIEMDVSLEITQAKQRQNDGFIMDILVNSGELLKKELLGINKYRQYLEVIMLSDIVDLRGRRILQDIKEGTNRRKSKFDFAKQEPIELWAKWWTSKACPILEKNLGKKHLGQWISKSHQIWEWEYGTQGEEQYLRSNDKVYQRTRGRYVWQPSVTKDELNMFDQWADVGADKHNNPYAIATTFKRELEAGRSNDVRSRLEKDTKRLHRMNWGNVEFIESRNVLVKAILEDDYVAATDGSNKNDEGAQAWLVSNRAGVVLVRGRGRVPCAKQDASSLRPELAALLAVTTFVEDFVQKEKIECERSNEITIYTDSANAISDMKSGMYPSTKNVLENNIDMKLELKQVLRKSKNKYHLQHVKAHQDRHMEVEDLPFDAKLNKLVDEYAGGVYEDITCGEHDDFVPFYNAQICSLKLPFGRPVSNVCAQLVAFTNGHLSEAQLAKFWNIEEKWLCNIEWEAFRVAVRRARNATKSRLCKLAHKQLPTLKMMQRNGMSLTNLCPLCKKKVEDWDHVFQCKSVVARAAREENLVKLRKILQTRKTHPVVTQRIMALLYQWTQQYKITVPRGDGNLNLINQAFADQCNLGVSNMMAGVLTHKFGDIQEAYYSQIEEKGVRFTKREWNINVIRALLQYGEAIWKARCDYVHEESHLTMENQTKVVAMRIRSNLLKNPWKLRQEDKELMQRKVTFFQRAGAKQLNRWIERVLVSLSIAQDYENATRQDIRKWMNMPDGGYSKKIKYPRKAISKKYIQLTLNEFLLESSQAIPATNDIDEGTVVEWSSAGNDNTLNDESVQMSVIDECAEEPMCTTNTILGTMNTWFIKKLGRRKENDNDSKASTETEEIIFAEEQDSFDENCFTAVSTPVNDEYRYLECDISSTNSIDEPIEFEILLADDYDNGSDSSSECIETFEEYINDRCSKVNPVKDILNNVRTHHWKDFFKTSHLSQNECSYKRINFDSGNVQSDSMASVELNPLGSGVRECEHHKESEDEHKFCEISTLEAFGVIDQGEPKAGTLISCGILMERNVKEEKSVLVDEIENEGDTMQSQTNAISQHQSKGNHLVCDSHNMRPNKALQYIDSFNHIREGSAQSQTFIKNKHKLKKLNSRQKKHAGQASPFIPTSKQDINKGDGNHATRNGQEHQDLSSMQMEQRNNGKTTYHMVENQNTNNECVPEDPSDVICVKKFLKFSQSRGNKTSMQNEMTSDFTKIGFRETGLVARIECKKLNSTDGNLDVDPSTYPTGCPKNYFTSLIKSHTKS